MDEDGIIKIKIAFLDYVLSMDICNFINYDELMKSVKQGYDIKESEVITIKWIDDQGDACTISTELELNEAKCTYNSLKMECLVFNAFKGDPIYIGGPCLGEENLYRIGAKRWKQLFGYNSHIFQQRRFSKICSCIVCNDIIWGIGRQGVRCKQCKLFVHKKCYSKVSISCSQLNLKTKLLQNENKDDSSQEYTKNIYSNGKSSNFTKYTSTVNDENTDQDLSFKAVGLKDFNFIRIIGRGSYAKVMLVKFKKNNKYYALKIIKKSIFVEEDDLDWIQAEKRVFEKVSNYPFLVGLHSCFQTTSRLFFVIEYISGGDMMYHMQKKKKLTEDETRFYCVEICLGLNYLHNHRIIYRDLKLDNVLINFDGHVKLTDYGMCKEDVSLYSRASTFCGTPNYIAPEVLRNETYGYSVDLWALGVLTYEMLAGRSPFDIAMAADTADLQTEEFLFKVILEKEIRIPRSLSVRASDFLKRLLKKWPNERLGCDSILGIKELQDHPFFKGIEWEEAEKSKLKPPYIPKVNNDQDHSNFDPVFTNEPVQLTPDDPIAFNVFDQSEFEGFEFINPLFIEDPIIFH